MQKRRVLYCREPEVHTILLRQLARTGFRVYPKVRLADAIGKSEGERLTSREFAYFTRAHFDFLVVSNDAPIFAVEFDGACHRAPDAVERDLMKNRLCKSAELPLLRITSVEIAERDRLTLLDYMLMRHVAWQREIAGIMHEIDEFAATLPREARFEDYDGYVDPHLQFDIRHPFPGSDVVKHRLWVNHRIVWEFGDRPLDVEPAFHCNVSQRRWPGRAHDEFLTCERVAAVWPAGADRNNTVFRRPVGVSMRRWLPLKRTIPNPEVSITDLTQLSSAMERATRLYDQHAAATWTPHLSGVSVWDITEHYSEYLALRAVEKWAKAAAKTRPLQQRGPVQVRFGDALR